MPAMRRPIAAPRVQRRELWQAIAAELGPMKICSICGTTLAAYPETCTADAEENCPGLVVVEDVRASGSAADAITRAV